MIVQTPDELLAHLTDREEKIINDCIYLLSAILEQMHEYGYAVLEDCDGNTSDLERIEDTQEALVSIRGTIKMYEDLKENL